MVEVIQYVKGKENDLIYFIIIMMNIEYTKTREKLRSNNSDNLNW